MSLYYIIFFKECIKKKSLKKRVKSFDLNFYYFLWCSILPGLAFQTFILHSNDLSKNKKVKNLFIAIVLKISFHSCAIIINPLLFQDFLLKFLHPPIHINIKK